MIDAYGSEVKHNDTGGDDETAEVLALAVLSLSTKNEGDDKDRNDLGWLHDGLDWEWHVSKGLTGQKDGSETAAGNEEFGFDVHLGLLLIVDESVNTSS